MRTLPWIAVTLTRDLEGMSVDVTTTPTFQAGTPKLLFKMDGPFPQGLARGKNVTTASGSFSRCRSDN